MQLDVHKGAEDAEKLKVYVEIWSKAVDTQMHFNEMSAKSRQLGLTFATAALGVAVVLLAQRQDVWVDVPFHETVYGIHVSPLIIAATAAAVYGVKMLDLNVYHRMLRGSVKFGEDFEENYLKSFIKLNKGMTQAITFYSRHSDASVTAVNSKYEYTGSNEITAERKIKNFYAFVVSALVVISVIVGWATLKVDPIKVQGTPNAPIQNKK